MKTETKTKYPKLKQKKTKKSAD